MLVTRAPYDEKLAHVPEEATRSDFLFNSFGLRPGSRSLNVWLDSSLHLREATRGRRKGRLFRKDRHRRDARCLLIGMPKKMCLLGFPRWQPGPIRCSNIWIDSWKMMS